MRAAVTGATGFLGRHLVTTLQAEGWDVRVLVRRAPPDEPWRAAAAEIVQGDLADRGALERLADGADVVIHVAGLIKARSRAAFMAVNEEGTRAVAEAVAAQAAGRTRMLLVSSLVAREPQLSAYAASKRAGEQAALGVLPPVSLTVVRPPAVYGPGDRETLALFRAAARLPLAPLLGPADARLALVHVRDAIEEIVRLAARPQTAQISTLGGDRPEGYGWSELMQTAAAALGRRVRPVVVPAALLRAAAFGSAAAMRLGGPTAMLTPGKAREILHRDWSVSEAELGPERRPARYTIKAGFAEAAAWYRQQGWL